MGYFSLRLNWERWLLLFLIALCIGLLAAFMKQCLQLFNNLRWDRAKDFAAVRCFLLYTIYYEKNFHPST